MPQLTFEYQCNLISNDPIRGAQTAQQQCRNHRTRGYELAALAYALAARLSMDAESLSAFYRLPFFEDGYNLNRDHLLLHSHQFIQEERRGPEAERVGAHARAMQPAFDAGWSPERVLEALKANGGFSGLKASFAQLPQLDGPLAIGSNADRTRDTMHQPSSELSDSRPIDHSDGYKPEDRSSGSISAQPKKANRSRSTSAHEMLERYFMVEIEPPEAMSHLLQLPVGHDRYMRVTRMGDELDGFIVFKGYLDFSGQ